METVAVVWLVGWMESEKGVVPAMDGASVDRRNLLDEIYTDSSEHLTNFGRMITLVA